jgi:predicted ArsR family transcriptional regulator
MQKPTKLTTDELAEHLQLLKVASREDLDELLTDLLCHVYRTKDSQNS